MKLFLLFSILILATCNASGGCPSNSRKSQLKTRTQQVRASISSTYSSPTTQTTQQSSSPSSSSDAMYSDSGSTSAAATTSAAASATSSPDSGDSHTGDATYYTLYKNAGAMGSCGTPLPSDNMIVALSSAMNAGNCGKCISVQNADGTGSAVKVQVWDTCPECATDAIDLSDVAFQQLAPLSSGRIQVKWSFVPC